MPRTATDGKVYDFASSCGQCGKDFVFDTSRDRNDWFRAHPDEHEEFVSFFMQGRV